MEKFYKIKKLLFISLFLVPAFCFAADLTGQYCIPAMSGGVLVMDFNPTDSHHGNLSVFNASYGQVMCMGQKRPYSLNDNKLTSAGLQGNFDGANTVLITEPLNWSGPWDKTVCEEKYENPCD